MREINFGCFVGGPVIATLYGSDVVQYTTWAATLEDQILKSANNERHKLVKVKELKSKVKDFSLVTSGWNCKLCFKTEEECGESCKDKSWKDVSKENDALREDNQGCLKGSITAIPPMGCSPTVAMSTKLNPAPAGKKLKYCMAEFRAESARRYGEALLKHSKKLAQCTPDQPSAGDAAAGTKLAGASGNVGKTIGHTKAEEILQRSKVAIDTAWSLVNAFQERSDNKQLEEEITKGLQMADQEIQKANDQMAQADAKVETIKETKEKKSGAIPD